jgi:arginine repressor
LQIAIAAIERDEVESKNRIERQRPTRKRGQLQEAVIAMVGHRIGTVAAIVAQLGECGIRTTPASVSNVIQRLQGKKQIHYDQSERKWVLTVSDGNSGQPNGAAHAA